MKTKFKQLIPLLLVAIIGLLCLTGCGNKNTVKDTSDPTATDSGHTGMKQFDPFEGLVVLYDGISGKGTISVNSTKTKMPKLNFTASKTEGLSNGQKIKISIADSEEAKEKVRLTCMENGLEPTIYEKEYTVEGLIWFAQEISEVPADAIQEIFKNAEKQLRDRDTERFCSRNKIDHKNFRINSLKPVDAYFMVTTTDEEVVNQLVVIYQEDVYYEWHFPAPKEEKAFQQQYYNYAIFTNIVLSNDKSSAMLDLGEYSFCKNEISYLSHSLYRAYADLYGYQTADEIYQQYVKSQDYKYIVEKVNLAAYGK